MHLCRDLKAEIPVLQEWTWGWCSRIRKEPGWTHIHTRGSRVEHTYTHVEAGFIHTRGSRVEHTYTHVEAGLNTHTHTWEPGWTHIHTRTRVKIL